jgi:hypothetical protein
MYEYDVLRYGSVVIRWRGEDSACEEVFLQGDDATEFLRQMNRAGQKELSKRRNPNNIPIRQNIMSDYFVRACSH